MKSKSKQFLCGITLILIILFSNSILELQIVKSELVHSKNGNTSICNEVEIKDFSDFTILWDLNYTESTISDTSINFRSNVGIHSFECYLLNFSKYLLNGTNVELTINFNYNFSNHDAILIFQLGSYYRLSGEKILSGIEYSSIGLTSLNDLWVRVHTEYNGKNNFDWVDKYHHLSTINSSSFHLKKQGNTMKCSISDNTGRILLSKKWFSFNYYIPANFLLIGFQSVFAGNSVNITSIDGKITLKNIDWRAKIIFHKILVGIAGTVIAIIILGVIFWLLPKMYKNKQEKKRQSGRDFLAKLNQKSLSYEEEHSVGPDEIQK